MLGSRRYVVLTLTEAQTNWHKTTLPRRFYRRAARFYRCSWGLSCNGFHWNEVPTPAVLSACCTVLSVQLGFVLVCFCRTFCTRTKLHKLGLQSRSENSSHQSTIAQFFLVAVDCVQLQSWGACPCSKRAILRAKKVCFASPNSPTSLHCTHYVE